MLTSTCLAEVGNYVYCVDSNQNKIAKLCQGISPIYEPGLEPLISKNRNDNRLGFTTDVDEGLNQAEVVFIAVGTPDGENGEADVSYVLCVAQDIGKYLRHSLVVVDKSTDYADAL